MSETLLRNLEGSNNRQMAGITQHLKCTFRQDKRRAGGFTTLVTLDGRGIPPA